MAAPRRCMLVLAAIGFGFGLSGCASGGLELDPAYWFPDGKKKLPGDRREVFPGGVPGVTQGVPPELIRGNPDNPTNQPEQALAPVQEQRQPEPEAEERPRPRPKKVARPRPAPAPAQEPQAQPAQRPVQQQQQPAGAWPAPAAQQQSQQPQQQAPAAGAWPAPPASGTFTR